MPVLLQSILLALSFAVVFVWQNTPLSQYTIYVLAVLVVVYLAVSFKRKKGIFKMDGYNPGSIFVLNTILVLLVFATGGFSSPVFFLLYLLSFGVALALYPFTVFIFLVGISALFLPLALQDDVTRNFIMLGSLALLSLIAAFFGRTK